MKPILINRLGEHTLIEQIKRQQTYEIGHVTQREFPDGETYLKFECPVQAREVIILESLNQPNSKILPLLFMAATAKKLGARRVGLCAPYLAYMRQDKQFQSGESVTSDHFARLLSNYFDWLVTVDPHLHRHHQLSEIYPIPNAVLHAAPQISQWIAKKVPRPILIGPDRESEQWVRDVADRANAPYLILDKIRHGDRSVEVSKPAIEPYLDHTPVLVDDIISTSHTMIETLQHLNAMEMKPGVCIGVHAVFAENAYDRLLQAGIADIATCNTIPHPSNAIDLSAILLKSIQQQLEGD